MNNGKYLVIGLIILMVLSLGCVDDTPLGIDKERSPSTNPIITTTINPKITENIVYNDATPMDIWSGKMNQKYVKTFGKVVVANIGMEKTIIMICGDIQGTYTKYKDINTDEKMNKLFNESTYCRGSSNGFGFQTEDGTTFFRYSTKIVVPSDKVEGELKKGFVIEIKGIVNNGYLGSGMPPTREETPLIYADYVTITNIQPRTVI